MKQMYVCLNCGTKFNYSCGDIVRHKCPMRSCTGGTIVALDLAIADSIIELNRRGYLTEFCCSGHDDEPVQTPYISFSDFEDFNYENLLSRRSITKLNSVGWYINYNDIMKRQHITIRYAPLLYSIGDLNYSKVSYFKDIERDVAMEGLGKWIRSLPASPSAKSDDETFYCNKFNIEDMLNRVLIGSYMKDHSAANMEAFENMSIGNIKAYIKENNKIKDKLVTFKKGDIGKL